MNNMKKFKRALGIIILAAVFVGLFVWMIQDSSLIIAIKTWLAALGATAIITVGAVLATSD